MTTMLSEDGETLQVQLGAVGQARLTRQKKDTVQMGKMQLKLDERLKSGQNFAIISTVDFSANVANMLNSTSLTAIHLHDLDGQALPEVRLEHPVQIKFATDFQDEQRISCTFWDFEASTWSEQGCHLRMRTKV